MVKIDDAAFYSLTLRVVHPFIDPSDITERFDIEPRHAWKSGEQATTPAGTMLSYRRKESYWCITMEMDDNLFSLEINKLLVLLLTHKVFVQRIIDEGGEFTIYLQLPGSINIGDTIPPVLLAGLAELQVKLSIEVFPDMKRLTPM